jgi:hypothetical protein
MQKDHSRDVPLREPIFSLHLSALLLLYFGTPGLRSIGQTIDFYPDGRGINVPRPFQYEVIFVSRILKASVSIAAIVASLVFFFAFAWVGLSILGH